MTERVYIETTIVSYLTARPFRDVVSAGHQQTTQEWWETRRHDYDLCIAQMVLDEAAAGDADAAARRLEALQGIVVLEAVPETVELMADLMDAGALPENARNDALHIAIAAVHQVDILLTWNCRHIANATLRDRIETVCLNHGYLPPAICTPDHLM